MSVIATIDEEAAKEIRSLLKKVNAKEKFLTERGYDVCFTHIGGRSLSARIGKRITL